MKTLTYLVQDQFHFTADTDIKVMHAINQLYKNGCRFRLWYGDKLTGQSWHEENDIIGTVGRSTGIHIPLLIHSKRSTGGGAILTSAIVKIVNIQTGFVVYQHPTFNQSTFYMLYESPQSNNAIVIQDDENNIYARCNSVRQALNLADFMNGARNCK